MVVVVVVVFGMDFEVWRVNERTAKGLGACPPVTVGSGVRLSLYLLRRHSVPDLMMMMERRRGLATSIWGHLRHLRPSGHREPVKPSFSHLP